MWVRIDDGLLDHPKVFAAADLLGVNGPAIVIGFFTVAVLSASKHLSDGQLPAAVVKRFDRYVKDPLRVAEALTKVGLFEHVNGGWQIHDFNDWQPSAATVKQRRRDDRIRKRQARGRA